MSYCLNPKCPNRADPLNAQNRICRHCGSLLIFQGRYRIGRLLGEGGFGQTFEVNDGGILKVLKVLTDDNPKAIALFQREAQVLSHLNHPGIPRVEAEGYFTVLPRNSQQPLHCLVMQRIEGRNLEVWMADRHHLPIPQHQALNWLKQLAEILHIVHQQQFFHRDIKPSNIMLQPNGQLALIDFGSAREVTGTYLAKVGGGHQITGIVSPGYTPPEQANGKAVPQSDFFALGRTFVFLLTGKEPNAFPEDTRTGQLLWRSDGSRQSPTAGFTTNPLADCIDYMMAPFPGNRPQNTQVILKRLEEIEQEMQQPWGSSAMPARSPQPMGGIQPYQAAARIPTRLLRLNGVRNYSRHSRHSGRSRFHYKKALKSSQKFLVGGFFLALAGTATHLFGGFTVPNVSALLWLNYGSPGVMREVPANPEPFTPIATVSAQPLAAKQPITLAKTLGGHLWGVNSIALSPDSRLLVSGSVDKTVKLWDLESGQVRQSLSGHSNEIWSVTFSPDGSKVASSSGDGTIKVWETSTGKLLHTLTDHAAWVMSVAFSPDGKQLASGGFDNTIKLWNAETGELIRSIAGHSGWVFSLAYSPDGQLLASGSFDRTIKIWHTQTGEVVRTLEGGLYRFRSVAFSPNGQWVAGASGDSSILIWQVSSGQLVRSLFGHSDAVHAIAFSPDGQTLVSGGGSLDSTIKLWNIGTGQLLQTLKGHSDTINSVSISADGKMLTSGSQDNTIKVWQLQ
ncbi:serine/threonine protein kinase [Laspinema sp. D1]|uniref:Serine/threonine protein kinase n=1 Tax=Laspinema palackyanum D2a TaxID=2953684 RepID=A0ABT2MPW4_9CYAN|nr:serine/threonine protein kinase [Laspinema sp. D2a]